MDSSGINFISKDVLFHETRFPCHELIPSHWNADPSPVKTTSSPSNMASPKGNSTPMISNAKTS